MKQLYSSLTFVVISVVGSVALSPVQANDAVHLKPISSPGTWFSADDYPPAALRAGESGRTAFRLDVDATGRVTRCSITQSSGSDVLDRQTCSLAMAHASFTPAADRHGHAVPSAYSSAVKWQIPESVTTASMAGCALGIPDDIHVITPEGCI